MSKVKYILISQEEFIKYVNFVDRIVADDEVPPCRYSDYIEEYIFDNFYIEVIVDDIQFDKNGKNILLKTIPELKWIREDSNVEECVEEVNSTYEIKSICVTAKDFNDYIDFFLDNVKEYQSEEYNALLIEEYLYDKVGHDFMVLNIDFEEGCCSNIDLCPVLVFQIEKPEDTE